VQTGLAMLVAEREKKAGIIVLGKTNVPDSRSPISIMESSREFQPPLNRNLKVQKWNLSKDLARPIQALSTVPG
jgi:hypothetical protein